MISEVRAEAEAAAAPALDLDLPSLIQKVKACEMTPWAALGSLPGETPIKLELSGLGIHETASLEQVRSALGEKLLTRRPLGPHAYLDQASRYEQYPLAVLLEVGAQAGLLSVPIGDYQQRLSGLLHPMEAVEQDYLVLRSLKKSDAWYAEHVRKLPNPRLQVAHDFESAVERQVVRQRTALLRNADDQGAKRNLEEALRLRQAAKYVSPCPAPAAAAAPGTFRDFLSKKEEVAAPSKPRRPRGRLRRLIHRAKKYLCKHTDRCPVARAPRDCPGGVCPRQRRQKVAQAQAQDCPGGVCPLRRRQKMAAHIGAFLGGEENENDNDNDLGQHGLLRAALLAAAISSHLLEMEMEAESSLMPELDELLQELQSLEAENEQLRSSLEHLSGKLQATGEAGLQPPEPLAMPTQLSPAARASLEEHGLCRQEAMLLQLRQERKALRKQRKQLRMMLGMEEEEEEEEESSVGVRLPGRRMGSTRRKQQQQIAIIGQLHKELGALYDQLVQLMNKNIQIFGGLGVPEIKPDRPPKKLSLIRLRAMSPDELAVELEQLRETKQTWTEQRLIYLVLSKRPKMVAASRGELQQDEPRFSELMAEHVLLTIAAAEAVQGGEAELINFRVNELVAQIQDWKLLFLSRYEEAEWGESWEAILSEHTLLAKDFIVAVIRRPEGYAAQRQTALEGLLRNGVLVKDFLEELPGSSRAQIQLGQLLWDQHLECTVAYNELLGDGQEEALESRAYQEATQDCLQKGRAFGEVLDRLTLL